MVDASPSFARRRPTFGPVMRRRIGALAASVLFHIAILTPLALRLFEPPLARPHLADDMPVFLEMEPRPLLPGEVARVPAPAPARTEPTPTLGDLTAERSTAPAAPGQSEAMPSPLSPRIAAEAPADAPATVDPWQVTPETMRAAVARSMRLGAAGCRTMDGRLSPAEQQLCDERFNAAAGRAGPLGPRTLTASEARREAQFARDGAAALAQYEARRRPLSGGVGIVGASPDCPGGNLRGTCAGAHLRPGFEMTDERLRNNRKME